MNFDAVKNGLTVLKTRLVALEERAKALFAGAETEAEKALGALVGESHQIQAELHQKLVEFADFAHSIEGRLRNVEDKVGLGDVIAKEGAAAPAATATAPVADAPAPTGGAETKTA